MACNPRREKEEEQKANEFINGLVIDDQVKNPYSTQEDDIDPSIRMGGDPYGSQEDDIDPGTHEQVDMEGTDRGVASETQVVNTTKSPTQPIEEPLMEVSC